MHYINDLYTAFQAIPSGFWAALLASGVLSTFMQAIQHVLAKFDKKLTDLSAWLLLLFLSCVGAGLQYLLSTPTASPKIAALHAAVLAFMAQPVYYAAVKPLYARLIDYLERRAALKAGVMDAKVTAPVADFNV